MTWVNLYLCKILSKIFTEEIQCKERLNHFSSYMHGKVFFLSGDLLKLGTRLATGSAGRESKLGAELIDQFKGKAKQAMNFCIGKACKRKRMHRGTSLKHV